jgi:hypothetical protein
MSKHFHEGIVSSKPGAIQNSMDETITEPVFENGDTSSKSHHVNLEFMGLQGIIFLSNDGW